MNHPIVPRPKPLEELGPWPDGSPPKILPRHIAIIMDGNGRWAKRHRIARIKGHEAGAQSVRDVLKFCGELGIERLTLYAFSTENWNRSKFEVNYLWKLMEKFLLQERDQLRRQGVRLSAIGDISAIPKKRRKTLEETIEYLQEGTLIDMAVALNYGGRQEITRAAQRIAEKAAAGEIDPKDVNMDTVRDHLWAPDAPDPDLLIRTAGEMRVSNYLLWQIAYTEFWVTETLWPDFRREHLRNALADYASRTRTFGKRPKTRRTRG